MMTAHTQQQRLLYPYNLQHNFILETNQFVFFSTELVTHKLQSTLSLFPIKRKEWL